jgi:hypothetical protein
MTSAFYALIVPQDAGGGQQPGIWPDLPGGRPPHVGGGPMPGWPQPPGVGVWPNPFPPYPDQGLPGGRPPHVGGGPMPGGPGVSLPIVIPPGELPVDPIPSDKIAILVFVPGFGAKIFVVPKPPGYVDNTLPSTPEPK